jgi:hypothetical protein
MNYAMHDRALESLRDTGPELRSGAPNHAPMVVETLAALGRDDAVPGWIDSNRLRFVELPRSDAILDGAWGKALGDFSRLAAWQNSFHTELEGPSWREVLNRWLPRLIPGSLAAGTHGIIRCGHAVRALENQVTTPRLEELANALAYCAARYFTVSSPPRLAGDLSLDEAARGLPLLARVLANDFDRVGPPPRIVKRLNEHPEFTAAVQRLALPSDESAALSELAEIGGRLYLRDPTRHPLVLLHAVTGPAAVQLLLANASSELRGVALAYAWQAVAAWTVAFSSGLSGEPLPVSNSWEEIIDLSIESGDEHAIKLTEACRRQEALRPSLVFRATAFDWVQRVIESRNWSAAELIGAGIATRLRGD